MNEAHSISSFSSLSCSSLHGVSRLIQVCNLLVNVVSWFVSPPSTLPFGCVWLSRALSYIKSFNLMIIRNRLGDSIHCLRFKHIILEFRDGLDTVFKHPVNGNLMR